MLKRKSSCFFVNFVVKRVFTTKSTKFTIKEIKYSFEKKGVK